MCSTADTILGKGEFGIVYKGLAHSLPTVVNGPTVVAVKTLVNTADPDQVALFVDEFNVMVKAGHHINIVNLLGIMREGMALGTRVSYKKAFWAFYYLIVLKVFDQ